MSKQYFNIKNIEDKCTSHLSSSSYRVRTEFKKLNSQERYELLKIVTETQLLGLKEAFKRKARKIRLYQLGTFTIHPSIIAQQEVLHEYPEMDRQSAWKLGVERLAQNESHYSDKPLDLTEYVTDEL